MSLPLLLSLLIYLLATGWAVALLKRTRDWRLLFLATLPGLLALNQALTLDGQPSSSGSPFLSTPATEWLWVLISIMVSLAVLFLSRIVIEQTEGSLRERERSFETLLSNLPGVVYRCENDAHWTMRFTNDGCYDLTGYAPDDLIDNRRISYAQLIHPDDRDEVRQQVERAIDAHRPYRLTYRIVTANGELKWVWEQGQGVYTADDTCKILEGFITDISKQKKYEEALKQARAEAGEANRLKSAFLSNMSHEVRTPLTSIIGLSSLLIDDASGERRTSLKLIRRNGERLLDMLSALIDLSMLQAETIELEPEWLDVTEEVKTQVQRLRSQAEEKGLHLDARTDPEIESYLDRDYLGRILRSLLSNAIKFTKQGHITVEAHGEAEGVVIAVTDTGVGISEPFQPHAFEPFKQESTGTDRAYEGAGLGLAVTKQLTDLMGGEISMESKPGQGSTFTLLLPRRIDENMSLAEEDDPGET